MDDYESIKKLYDDKEYDKVVKIIENKLLSEQVSSSLMNYFDWSCYRLIFRDDSAFSDQRIDKTKAFISRILKERSNEDFLFQLLVLKSVDHSMKNKATANYAKCSSLLDRLDPKLLSTKTSKFTKSDGKEVELASDQEKWYSYKTKCLEELEDYHGCIKYCLEAFDVLKTFHSDNDIWFKRRIAISKSALNQHEDALKLIEEILRKKRDWFIYCDMGNILIRSGNIDNGIKNYLKALMMPGPDDMKIRIYSYFLENPGSHENDEIKELLTVYIYKIRQKNAWPISDDMKNAIQQSSETVLNYSTRKMKELIIEKLELLYGNNDSTNGSICYIQPNGKTGFIISDTGVKVFFRVKSITNNTKGFSAGTKVSYSVIDSFDKTKNMKSQEAVEIKIQYEN